MSHIKSRRSKGWIINDAVREYLEREERRLQRDQDTLEAWEDYNAGRVIEGERVMVWLDSWGTEDELEPPLT